MTTPDTPPAAAHPTPPVLPGTRLDIHPVEDIQLGIFRDPFERVETLSGYLLRPSKLSPVVWGFRKGSAPAGYLMDVAGHLLSSYATFPQNGTVYLLNHKGHRMGLLFPPPSYSLDLTRTKVKILPGETPALYPEGWPGKLVTAVIRYRFRKVIVLNERFLLSLMLRMANKQTKGT